MRRKTTSLLLIASSQLVSTQLATAAFLGSKRVVSSVHYMTSRHSMIYSNETTEDWDKEIPPLRYLGDEKLMQQQPLVTKEQIQSIEFQQKLAMLPMAMKRYGGIGIAAPQVGMVDSCLLFRN